ncbi:MAG: DoxX family protein [Gemmatimonadaceae bacterium]|nr:DoxX family protein [Gemmatimonadaceae bacterium]
MNDLAPTTMRAPERWIAAQRMVVGVWFAKSILTKLGFVLVGGFLPLPAASNRWQGVMPKLIAKYASDNPFPWYKSFLLDTVIPNSHIFATLTALGEIGVGISLLFGLLTPVGAFVGLLQVVFYGMAVQQQSSGQLGFHVMLFILMLTFLFARAGRRWGIDARLRERWPDSRFVQLLT